jgi:hypothetical protein
MTCAYHSICALIYLKFFQTKPLHRAVSTGACAPQPSPWTHSPSDPRNSWLPPRASHRPPTSGESGLILFSARSAQKIDHWGIKRRPGKFSVFDALYYEKKRCRSQLQFHLHNHFFVDNYIAPNKIRTLFAPIFWGHISAADCTFFCVPFEFISPEISLSGKT